MGADFLQKAGRTINVAWDRQRLALATPDLFSRGFEAPCTVEPAEIVTGAKLTVGEELTVELSDRGLVAIRGMTEVARFNAASKRLLNAVAAAGGIVAGTVENLHPTAGIAEIEICP